jgi:hypothetical protein
VSIFIDAVVRQRSSNADLLANICLLLLEDKWMNFLFLSDESSSVSFICLSIAVISKLIGDNCEDNLDPQLDQGNEEVIRVALLTFDLKKVRANRLC